MIVTNGKCGINTTKHVIMTIQQQSVVLHNIALFNSNTDNQKSFCRRRFDLVLGYLFYLMPIATFGFLLLFAAPTESLQTICTKMDAPFLLDNSIPAAVNMTEMFEMRKKSDRRGCTIDKIKNNWIFWS